MYFSSCKCNLNRLYLKWMTDKLTDSSRLARCVSVFCLLFTCWELLGPSDSFRICYWQSDNLFAPLMSSLFLRGGKAGLIAAYLQLFEQGNLLWAALILGFGWHRLWRSEPVTKLEELLWRDFYCTSFFFQSFKLSLPPWISPYFYEIIFSIRLTYCVSASSTFSNGNILPCASIYIHWFTSIKYLWTKELYKLLWRCYCVLSVHVHTTQQYSITSLVWIMFVHVSHDSVVGQMGKHGK